MKLSICMIVKNEEKNLERCLKSLSTLRNQITSELIIVDTGSEDNTVQIAQKYTDKVYFHQWNNNFSDMRNISINYAKGQWIFIIDADEELCEEQEIIDFLNLKDTVQYNAVNMKVINIVNESDESLNSHGISTRIFRNDGEFRYEGVVHNIPIYKHPVKFLNSYLIHYGYINTDKELMEKKFNRTSKLLKQELEKNPDHIYYRFQLSVTYSMHGDYNSAFEEVSKAYNTLKRKKINSPQFIFVYHSLAFNAIMLKKYEECIKVSLEGIQIEKDYIDFYYCLGRAYHFTGKTKEAIYYYEKYLELLSNYDTLSIKEKPSIILYTKDRYNEVFIELATLYFTEKNIPQVINYLRKLPIENYSCIKDFLLNIKDINDSYYIEIFYEYLKRGYQFIINQFGENTMKYTEISKLRNVEYIFFVYMFKAEQIINTNPKESIQWLKSALQVFPDMQKGIQLILRAIKGDNTYKSSNTKEQEEFEGYKLQVKKTIREFINNNQLFDAENLIKEYEEIVKDDMEILMIKSDLYVKKMMN